MIDSTLPPLEAVRLAGEVQHVDAVLVVQRATNNSAWTDEWGILYFTLVGLLFVPATHVEAMTVADAFVIEVRGGGYIHAAAQGDARTEGRAAALDQLCEQRSLAASGNEGRGPS